jgi:hypothetical protein
MIKKRLSLAIYDRECIGREGRGMPRYFFYISHGKHTVIDSAGIELAGIEAARTHATTQIRDMRASLPAGHLQDWSGWTMTVVDAKGKTLLEIDFDLTLGR